MERRVLRNWHARCGVGEKPAMTSKAYLSLLVTSALSDDLQMLSRNTIYTAVTRAKKKCIVVTDNGTAKKACEKESGYERITRLADEINYQKARLDLFLKLM